MKGNSRRKSLSESDAHGLKSIV